AVGSLSRAAFFRDVARPPRPTLFPYTTLFRSREGAFRGGPGGGPARRPPCPPLAADGGRRRRRGPRRLAPDRLAARPRGRGARRGRRHRAPVPQELLRPRLAEALRRGTAHREAAEVARAQRVRRAARTRRAPRRRRRQRRADRPPRDRAERRLRHRLREMGQAPARPDHVPPQALPRPLQQEGPPGRGPLGGPAGQQHPRRTGRLRGAGPGLRGDLRTVHPVEGHAGPRRRRLRGQPGARLPAPPPEDPHRERRPADLPGRGAGTTPEVSELNCIALGGRALAALPSTGNARDRCIAPTRPGLAARSGSVHLQCPWRSGLEGPPFGGPCARSLHRSGSPRGSLRDQVLASSNLPSDAIAGVKVGAGLRPWLRSSRQGPFGRVCSGALVVRCWGAFLAPRPVSCGFAAAVSRLVRNPSLGLIAGVEVVSAWSFLWPVLTGGSRVWAWVPGFFVGVRRFRGGAVGPIGGPGRPARVLR